LNWHAACEFVVHHSSGFEVDISVGFDSFVRLATAVSLLALHEIGRGSGWHRARQRGVAPGGPRALRDAWSRGSPPSPGPQSEPEHARPRLHAIVAGAWIVLSLLLLGYATVEGELALADLDGLQILTTYTGTPFDVP
jgi:hypothetical protein